MRSWAYFDTSLVVKLDVEERGRDRVYALARRHRLLSSVILSVEVISALARRQRSGDLSVEAREIALRAFRRDLPSYDLVELTSEVRKRSETGLLSHSIRTLDAIHIASALVMREVLALPRLPFITSDRIVPYSFTARSSHNGPLPWSVECGKELTGTTSFGTIEMTSYCAVGGRK